MKKSLLKKAVSSILAVTVLSGYGIVSLAEEEEFSDIDVPEETEEIASEDPSDEPFVEEEAFEEEEPSVEEEIIVDAEVADEETEEVLASGVLITTQFPDAKLAECVGESCDRNGDNRLSDDEIALVTTLDCRNWGIKKLDGIEIFTSLKVLKVGMSYTSSGEANTIDVVDITKLPSLEELNCNNAHVWHLYTGDNPNLKELDAGNNSTLWGTLDLTGCTNLEYLNLNVTGLSSVDISNCHKLSNISISDSGIHELDISNCPYLLDAYYGSNSKQDIYPTTMNGFNDMIMYHTDLDLHLEYYYNITCDVGTTIYTPTWKHNSKGWWYEGTNGYYYKSCWMDISGKWYYFGKDGYAAKGWQKIGKKYYYFDKNNAMVTNEWIKDGSKWYYVGSNGAMATGWKQIKNKWYYFESSGAMHTGWLKSGSDWYYMNSDGSMATFKWVKSSGKWYYFSVDGKMVRSCNYGIKGKTYKFDANGVCLNP